MPRIARIGPIICIAILAAGCGGPSEAAVWTEPSGAGAGGAAASAAPSTPPASPTPAPAATVTAACPLLPIDEFKSLLGSANSKTQFTAKETAHPVDHDFATYECQYGSGGKFPFDLVVTATSQDFAPKKSIDTIAEGSHVVQHNVPGVGTAGVFYTDADNTSLIAVAKVSHGETRTVLFSAPSIVPEQNFVNLAKVVLDRI